jgi:peptidoglycan hydrolase CwlO-like protein
MNRKIVLSLLLSVFMLFIFTSCSDRNNENMNENNATTVNDNMKANAAEDNSAVIFKYDKDYTYDQRDELRDDLNDAIDNLNNKIDNMQNKIDKASEETQDWYNNKLNELKEKRASLKDKVDKIDNTSEQNWTEFQANLRQGWNEVQQSWNNILDHMKADTDNNY